MYFVDLQACILPIIMEWAQTLEAIEHEFYQDWKTKWKDKVTIEHGICLLQKTLGFHTMEDYYEILLQCTAIPIKLYLQYNVDEKKIYFTEHNVIAADSVPTKAQKNLCSLDHIEESAPEDIKIYPTDLPNSDFMEKSQPPRKTYYTSTEEYSFALFRHILFPIIRTWANTMKVPNHHFFLTWKTWEQNIMEDSAFSEVQKWTKIQHLQDYMEYLQAYPAILSTISLTWDPCSHKKVWE
jgi:hypothetical protein